MASTAKQHPAIPKPLLAYQPFKLVWTLFAITSTLARFPIWLLYFIPKSLRQDPRWTYQQALGNQIIRTFLWHSAMVRVNTPLSLKAGAEGDKFVLMQPAGDEYYKGVCADEEIRPVEIGGSWVPSVYQKNVDKGSVVLHIHGGAYAVNAGREAEVPGAAILAKYTWSRVFLVQYRLSSNPGGRFPAALQDAITAYKYLLDQGIPASKIVLSGDSAGGHCVMTFLRYLHDNDGVLPSPGGALLWSPWLDMETAVKNPRGVSGSRYEKTDYLCDEFTRWGVGTFIPSFMKPSDPYLTFLGSAFKTDVPLWIMAGGVEVLYPDICQARDELKAVGNNVTYFEVPHANHDIFIIFTLSGFKNEMVESAKEVAKWFKTVGIESG